MNWQPIDTAPKDGTSVLIFIPDTKYGGKYDSVTISRWYVHYMNGQPNPRRKPEWEQKDMYAGMGSYQGPIYPTHWMPLPTPPTSPPPAEQS
jgi:hypothetical protein